MRIAVSTLGPGVDALVDERFGRARYLQVFEGEDRVVTLDNAVNFDALQGAGIGAAEKVVEQGVDAVITGHLGPKAYRALQAAGVRGYNGAGLNAREAIRAFHSDGLPVLSEGEAHSGVQ
jgi:predicted Fe-Mo cluster-binding NifX family protein